MVMDELRSYASPKARLTRLLKSGQLIQLRRGLFTDDPAVSRRVLAAVLYGPSYISFEYVLAAAALIPERVTVMRSASFNKNKDKVFRTPLGEFRYLYLPPAVYPYGITMEEENGYSYLIATPEKALCDLVYKVPGIASVGAMNELLLEDWRVDPDGLAALDRDFIRWIAPRYRRKSVLALAAWFTKEAV
jgi:phage terminase large subunit-like protein